MKKGSIDDFDRPECFHNSDGHSCSECGEVVFKLNAGNAGNLIPILEDLIKRRKKWYSNYKDTRFVEDIINELHENSFRLQPSKDTEKLKEQEKTWVVSSENRIFVKIEDLFRYD